MASCLPDCSASAANRYSFDWKWNTGRADRFGRRVGTS
jgi:hypothetical protein